MNFSPQDSGGAALLRKAVACLALFGSAFTCAADGAKGYIGVYGGGPLYQHADRNVNELKNSSFNEIIIWSVQVSASGDLNLNGEFPLTSGGVYVGNNTWPNFAADLVTLKQGSAKRITFSVGSSNANPSDFDHIKALVLAQGTGPDSALYRSFQALKRALPSVDAIDFDDESTYDASTMTQFGVMLGNLGFRVTMSPYVKADFWTSVVADINARRPGTVDGVHLQAYSGGARNSPCSGWNFGSVPVFPGLWSANATPPAVQAKMQAWKNECGITGGFMWLFDEFAGKAYNGQSATQAYALAISNGVGGSHPVDAKRVQAQSSDGTAITRGGIDGVGHAYSSNLLGSSVRWNGSTFPLGAANAGDGWYDTTIALPAGRYDTLKLLATGVQGNQAGQTFVINYTDGTSTTVTQSLSDWYSPQSHAGEAKAATMAYRNNADGTKDRRTFHLYGYAFAINGAKTVKSLTLPSNRNVVVLSFALSNAVAAQSAVLPGGANAGVLASTLAP
ncbi:hypothetical protein ACG04Q_08930 [Roseateles sp. DXS20W]|uniref:Uncharacterized protein n=1 Tax=Pelomonas lactea TaxID=3299030 RepID=A0ABW7GIA7_9BURK